MDENKALDMEKQALAAKNEELTREQSQRKAGGDEELLQLRQQVKRLEDTNANLCKENLELMTELDAQTARAGEDSFVIPNPTQLKAEILGSAGSSTPFKSPFKSPAPAEFDKTTSDSFSAEIFQDDSFIAANTTSTPKPTPTPITATPTETTTSTSNNSSKRRTRTKLGSLPINSPLPKKRIKKDMPSAIKPCKMNADDTTAPTKEGGIAAGEEQPPDCKTQ